MKQISTIETNGERQSPLAAPPTDEATDDVRGQMWMLYAAGAAFGFAMGAGYLGYTGIAGEDVTATKTKYN